MIYCGAEGLLAVDDYISAIFLGSFVSLFIFLLTDRRLNKNGSTKSLPSSFSNRLSIGLLSIVNNGIYPWLGPILMTLLSGPETTAIVALLQRLSSVILIFNQVLASQISPWLIRENVGEDSGLRGSVTIINEIRIFSKNILFVLLFMIFIGWVIIESTVPDYRNYLFIFAVYSIPGLFSITVGPILRILTLRGDVIIISIVSGLIVLAFGLIAFQLGSSLTVFNLAILHSTALGVFSLFVLWTFKKQLGKESHCESG